MNKEELVQEVAKKAKVTQKRTGRNPQTGKEIKIAAKTVPAFSAGKKFKELVNKK